MHFHSVREQGANIIQQRTEQTSRQSNNWSVSWHSTCPFKGQKHRLVWQLTVQSSNSTQRHARFPQTTTSQHPSAQAVDQHSNGRPHTDNLLAIAQSAHYVGRTNIETTDKPRHLTIPRTSRDGTRKAPRANSTAYHAQSPFADRGETRPSHQQISYHHRCHQRYGTFDAL